MSHHTIVGRICIHSKHHKSVRPEISGALCHQAKTCNAAEQRKDDWYGKTANYHGKEQGKCNDTDAADATAEQPEDAFPGKHTWKSCEFSTDKEKHANPNLSESSHLKQDDKFGKNQIF